MRKLSFLLLTASLFACSPNVETRGHLHDDDWKQQVMPGQSTREQVIAALGSPSSRSTFGPETWYYISTRRESVAFLRPEVADQDTIRVTFDSAGTVQAVDEIGKDKAHELDYATRETPTEGHHLGFFEQLLGNLGRFNSPGTTPGSSPTGGTSRRPPGS